MLVTVRQEQLGPDAGVQLVRPPRDPELAWAFRVGLNGSQGSGPSLLLPHLDQLPDVG